MFRPDSFRRATTPQLLSAYLGSLRGLGSKARQSRTQEPDREIRVGYICPMFPLLTETFVYNEVIKLKERTLPLDVFSIRTPPRDTLSPAARDLTQGTFYVLPIRVRAFALAHLYFLLRKPFRYLHMLFTFAIAKHLTDITRMRRTLFHFLEAVYIAHESRKRGISHHHAHFATGPASVAMFVSLLNDTTFSFTVHARDLFFDKLLLKDKLRFATFVVAISQYNKRTLMQECPDADPDKIKVIRCGVDLNMFQPRRPKAVHEKICLLSIGRLVETKGFPFLLHACKLIKERGQTFHCLIVGEGPDRPLLQHLVRDLRLEEEVTLVGSVFHDSVKDYYHMADIFVLPCVIAKDNDRDGIPVVLIEAMAMELPCISTAVSGIPELIEHLRSGLLVAPRHVPELADAIETLITNQRLRAELGTHARRTVGADFNIEANSDRLAEIFRSLPVAASTGIGVQP